VSYVTVNAETLADLDFHIRIREVVARLGIKAHGQYGYGLTGNLHCHLMVIHECDRARLKADLKAFFPAERQVQVKKLWDRQSVGEAVSAITEYGCRPLKDRDADRSGHRWSIVGISHWMLEYSTLVLPAKVELGFARPEIRTATALVKSKLVRRPKDQMNPKRAARLKAFTDRRNGIRGTDSSWVRNLEGETNSIRVRDRVSETKSELTVLTKSALVRDLITKPVNKDSPESLSEVRARLLDIKRDFNRSYDGSTMGKSVPSPLHHGVTGSPPLHGEENRSLSSAKSAAPED
jgi:hypothetical protein